MRELDCGRLLRSQPRLVARSRGSKQLAPARRLLLLGKQTPCIAAEAAGSPCGAPTSSRRPTSGAIHRGLPTKVRRLLTVPPSCAETPKSETCRGGGTQWQTHVALRGRLDWTRAVLLPRALRQLYTVRGAAGRAAPGWRRRRWDMEERPCRPPAHLDAPVSGEQDVGGLDVTVDAVLWGRRGESDGRAVGWDMLDQLPPQRQRKRQPHMQHQAGRKGVPARPASPPAAHCPLQPRPCTHQPECR